MGKLKDTIVGHLKTLKNIKGDFAEFGVYKGTTFVRLLPLAKQQNKKLHGFDSFRGMWKPTQEDFNSEGKTSYPRGKFDVGGSSSLIKKLTKLGYKQKQDYILWEGYIPQIFKDITENIKFSFCYIDLDQYKPTLAGLKWAWKRLSIGGIILCDDYFTNRKFCASRGIDEFLSQHNDVKIIGRNNWIGYDRPRPFPVQILFKKVKKGDTK